jgi:hypothetical protein
MKFKECENYCDYENYYLSQIGGNLSEDLYYNPLKQYNYQRGSGWFSRFATRYAIPAIKYIGKRALNVGRDIILDIASGKNVRESTKSNFKKGVSESLKELSSKMTPQQGSGKKRKRSKSKTSKNKVYKKRKINLKSSSKRKVIRRRRRRKVKKDIFM